MKDLKKTYKKTGKGKPCFLSKNDIVKLSEIIEETFTKAEKERFYRVSTTLAGTRVFSPSIAAFLAQPDLAPRIYDLSFWIEGWDEESRFDKNVLLDFSRYSVQLDVAGADPVWVHDKFNKIVKFLNSKTAWYWPIIILEKYLTFFITIFLLGNIIISVTTRERAFYLDKLGLFVAWAFFVFYDTRKIWPYSVIALSDRKPLFIRENIMAALLIILLVLVLLLETVFPLFG